MEDDASVLTGDITEDLEKSVNIIEEAKQDAQAGVSGICYFS